ncbi:hypothetical protein [Adhaeribacter aquaticus]|uniref:hypothetical protein n=1 Tax=Adhaeribacter aquaticus TaxID=299567 RepID=UPI00041B092B|nr:hypothetical protein [Adhaeribacter aquaticus]
MSTSDLKLLALFFIIAAVIILRVTVESTGYRDPDSNAFLEVSQNILDGKGFYHSKTLPIPEIKTLENQTYFAIWPLGYPILISGFAYLLSLPVFWASKVVNIFFLGLCLLLFRKMNREYAYLLTLIMCSFTFMEIFSYTWSEPPFIFCLLWFVYLLYNFMQDENNNKYLILLFISSLLLFFIRYIGGFSFIILGLLSTWFLLKKRFKPALKLLSITILLSTIAGLYLYNNYIQTGYLTGGERFFPDRESTSLFVYYLFVGLFNELFVIRNYYWGNSNPDLLFWVTAIFQFSIMIFIYLRFIKRELTKISSEDNLSILFGIIGFIYLFVLILLRKYSPFDPFDYRLLSPFSICIYTALMLFLINPVRSTTINKSYKFIILFFFSSLILNLPKVYLFEVFRSLIQN